MLYGCLLVMQFFKNMKRCKNIIYFLPILVFTKIAQANILDTDVKNDVTQQTNVFKTNAGFGLSNIGNISETVITAFLSLLGLIFLILMIIAGYSWMTAAGDESKVSYAKETMKRAVIGLLITVAAYTITYFVFSNIDFGPTGASNNP